MVQYLKPFQKKDRQMNNTASNNKNETKKLGIVLAVCLIVLIVIAILLIKTFAPEPVSTPKTQYIELPIKEGISLEEAKAKLLAAGISFEIIPTQSRTPNRVEKIEYIGKTEGEKALAEVGTAIKLHANEVGSDKIIYLTFDDGPTRDNTFEILDTLDNYGIVATFFVQGKNVHSYPDRMVATIERGHLIGCHSYSHEIESIYTGIPSFMAEVEQYENTMKNAIGEEAFASISKVMRFPGGTTTNSMLSRSEALEYVGAARENGYKVYDWTALTGDAEGYSTAQEFISYMQDGLASSKANNKPLIVLLHDKWSTNEALEEILDFLVSEGYYFDTVDNCPEYTFAEN